MGDAGGVEESVRIRSSEDSDWPSGSRVPAQEVCLTPPTGIVGDPALALSPQTCENVPRTSYR